MAMYLGSKKVAVTNTVEKQIPSMKAFFEAGGKCANSTATSFDWCWQYDDTLNVTDMNNMFYNCSSLKTVPSFNTGNVTNMSYMFYNCSSLKTVPSFNTANVTNMNGMFYYCSQLETVPSFNTVNVTNMSYIFYNCYSLKTVPSFNTGNVTNMSYMFYNCSSLKSIHMININANLSISDSTEFTRDALLEIIGNLKAQTSGTKRLTMGATNLAKLTDEDKAIATNKGWTLA